MNKVIVVVGTLVLFSCSTQTEEISDEKFCECMKLTSELSEINSKLLDGDVSKKEADDMKALRVQKKKACKDYEVMGGDELKKRQAGCK